MRCNFNGRRIELETNIGSRRKLIRLYVLDNTSLIIDFYTRFSDLTTDGEDSENAAKKWSKYLSAPDDDDDNEEARGIIKSNLLQLTSQEVIDEEDSGFGSKMTLTKSATKTKITETLRDSCLPKMLCEMAARPNQLLNDREKDLLSLIK